MKLLAPQIWREYFWLFNRTCALSICFWGFSCQGKKSIWYKIPQSGRKRSNFYELYSTQKSLEGESEVERLNYSVTLVHKKTRANIIMSIFLQLWKALSRSGFSSQTDATAVFSMESSAFSEKRTDICLLLVSSIA